MFELSFKLHQVEPVHDLIDAAVETVWGHSAGDRSVVWKHNGSEWVLTIRLSCNERESVEEFRQEFQTLLDHSLN